MSPNTPSPLHHLQYGYIPTEKVLEFEEALFEYIKTKYPEIPESIKETRVLSDEAEQKLIQAIGECKAKFSAAE